MIIPLILAAILQVEAYPIGQTINKDRTLVYWVVEFSGEDCGGNIHRWREQVDVEGEKNSLEVAAIGNNQLVAKLETDPQARGFVGAICEYSNTSELFF